MSAGPEGRPVALLSEPSFPFVRRTTQLTGQVPHPVTHVVLCVREGGGMFCRHFRKPRDKIKPRDKSRAREMREAREVGEAREEGGGGTLTSTAAPRLTQCVVSIDCAFLRALSEKDRHESLIAYKANHGERITLAHRPTCVPLAWVYK